MGTTCSCGQGHATYGACLRAKNIRVSHCQSWKGLDFTRTKNVQRELDEYARARAQGIQPAGTKLAQTRTALDISDKTGRAFDAGSPSVPFAKD